MIELRCTYCGEVIKVLLPCGAGWLPLHSCKQKKLEHELAKMERNSQEELWRRYETA